MTTNKLMKGFALTVWTLGICFPVVALAQQDFSLQPFLEVRQRFEDNVLQVPAANAPKSDFVTNIWAGVDLKLRLDEQTRIAARYEAAPRRFIDISEKNRQDHLLSALFRRRLRRDVTFLTIGNVGLRSQPNDPINEYFKWDTAGQIHVRWSPLWSTQVGAEIRNKYYPNNEDVSYLSFMVEGRVQRRIGAVSRVRGGYQRRTYDGAIDPRVLVSDVSRDMEGVRHRASVGFESLLFGKVLMDWKYQLEVDIAERELQRRERLARELEQSGGFERGHDDDDDDEDVDFNFTTHRVATLIVWRLSSHSTMSLSARHDLKSFRDWPVPKKNRQRRDNWTLLRLFLKQELTSNWSARLEYTLEKNNSNDPTQEYTDNAYSIRLQFGF